MSAHLRAASILFIMYTYHMTSESHDACIYDNTSFLSKGHDIPKSLICRCNEVINGLSKDRDAVEHPIH